ncbi:hypothetical protein TNCV_4306121 [Trichonephila clavipes]|nr:hypothetical protein TNCV_4306121 [Trichonephila clavipes]
MIQGRSRRRVLFLFVQGKLPCYRVRQHDARSNSIAISMGHPTTRQSGIIIWDTITFDSRSSLVRIQVTLTAQ